MFFFFSLKSKITRLETENEFLHSKAASVERIAIASTPERVVLKELKVQ